MFSCLHRRRLQDCACLHQLDNTLKHGFCDIKTLMVWALGGLQDLECVKSSDPRRASDLQVGGTPAVLKYLLEQGLIDGSCLTVTGTHMPLPSSLYKTADMAFRSLPIACFSDGDRQDNLEYRGVYQHLEHEEPYFFPSLPWMYSCPSEAKASFLLHRNLSLEPSTQHQHAAAPTCLSAF